MQEPVRAYVTEALQKCLDGMKFVVEPVLTGTVQLTAWTDDARSENVERKHVLRYIEDVVSVRFNWATWLGDKSDGLVAVCLWANNLAQMLQKAAEFITGVLAEDASLVLRAEVYFCKRGYQVKRTVGVWVRLASTRFPL